MIGLVEVPEEHKETFERAVEGTYYALIGRVRRDKTFIIHGLNREIVVSTSVDELMDAWRKPL